MNTFKAVYAIAAIAAAVSSPTRTASASEGPYEINGKTVFEIKRETQAKRMAEQKKQQEMNKITDEQIETNRLERVFVNTTKSAS